MPRTKPSDRECYPSGRANPIEDRQSTAEKFQDKAGALQIPAHKEAGYTELIIGVLEPMG